MAAPCDAGSDRYDSGKFPNAGSALTRHPIHVEGCCVAQDVTSASVGRERAWYVAVGIELEVPLHDTRAVIAAATQASKAARGMTASSPRKGGRTLTG